MLVKATKVGFDGQKLRQPGEVFEIDLPASVKASWFVKVPKPRKPRTRKAAK